MNRSIPLILSVIAMAMAGIAVWKAFSASEIVYVRTGILVEGYEGMKEAKAVYKQKTEGWQGNIDTLQADFQRSLRGFNADLPKLSEKERKVREENLRRQEMNLRNYTMAIEERAREEDDKLTEGVLNQVNSFVEDYGERKGYDLILGVTLTGNVMYGDKARDITGEVLEALNENYKKGGGDEKDK